MAGMLLGCIADDFTGATDLGSTLVNRGMSTVQMIGVPRSGAQIPEAEAIVVALKSRNIPASEAVRQSLAACRWLRQSGARRLYFKYCSTFDSTDQGNIGPVAEALLGELGADFTTHCPAFPENGRTIYHGHLYVGRQLLSESPMRDHPSTPMKDSNLVRVLGRQVVAKVDLVTLDVVRKGADAIRAEFARLRGAGVRHAIVDAIEDGDLLNLGEAGAELALMAGGSGAAIGLPDNFRRAGMLAERIGAVASPMVGGLAAVISGSCSVATLGQVAAMRRRHPARELDPMRLATGEAGAIAEIIAWSRPLLPQGPILIHAGQKPERLAEIQRALGREKAGAMIESALAGIARELVSLGVRRLVVAGGETSGAVVAALGIRALRIGPRIAPGVPATLSIGGPTLALALKSGNFGAEDFFLRALEVLR